MKKIDLLRNLVYRGLKIFTVKDVREESDKIGLHDPIRTIHTLKKEGWIEPLKRGVYAITKESGFTSPPHDFEIAMSLVNPCAISHWTAFHYHHLTQQTPNVVHAITPITKSRLPKRPLFHFIRVKSEYFFGIQKVWVGESRVMITDPERTLLDGLNHPEYCGGFDEVISAFKMRGDELDLDKIIDYSKRLNAVSAKRLGFILEYLGVDSSKLKTLEDVPIRARRKLDPKGSSQGRFNKKWNIIENI